MIRSRAIAAGSEAREWTSWPKLRMLPTLGLAALLGARAASTAAVDGGMCNATTAYCYVRPLSLSLSLSLSVERARADSCTPITVVVAADGGHAG
eukprot:COSAG02_NODE_362_length_23815_cov_27.096981_17_plen_95_part_00